MIERTADEAPLALPANDDDGLSAFFIHSEAIRRGDLDLVRRCIVEKGFDVLLEVPVAGNADVAVADVGAVLIAYDLLPIPSGKPERANQRNEIAAGTARKEVSWHGAERGNYVPVPESASGAAAWALLERLAPDRLAEIHAAIQSRVDAFATASPVQELSSVACRAKVELAEFKGALAVRKTFRPGAERYLQRELAVFRELGPHCDAIPRLLEQGRNYFVMEYIDPADQLGIPNGESLLPLPLRHVRELAEFVRTCVAHGFDPVDLKPDGNAVFTRNGLRVIDYEYWQRCSPATLPEESFCLAGLPEGFDGDRPMGLPAPFRPYPMKWIIFTGLPVRSFLYDPAWLQRLKRLPWPAIATLRRAFQFVARRLPGKDHRPIGRRTGQAPRPARRP